MELYVEQMPGMESPHPDGTPAKDTVCLLHKCLEGLKQAGNIWQTRHTEFLLTLIQAVHAINRLRLHRTVRPPHALSCKITASSAYRTLLVVCTDHFFRRFFMTNRAYRTPRKRGSPVPVERSTTGSKMSSAGWKYQVEVSPKRPASASGAR